MKKKALPPPSRNWDKGVRLRDQAVLCRSNRRLNEIAAALEARNIPVLHLGSLFERDEIRDLLALMSLAVDPFGDALVRVGALPRYGIPLQDIHLALTHLRDERKRSVERLDELAALAGLSKEGAVGFRQLAADLKTLAPQSQPWDFLTTYLLDRTDIGRTMAGAATVPARMRNVAAGSSSISCATIARLDSAFRFSAPSIASASLCCSRRSAICVKCPPLPFTWMRSG